MMNILIILIKKINVVFADTKKCLQIIDNSRIINHSQTRSKPIKKCV